MCLHDDQLKQTLHTGGKALSKPLLHKVPLKTQNNRHQINNLSATRPIPPPHAGGEVLSAQVLQIRKCQTTEGCCWNELAVCYPAHSNVCSYSFRRALTPAPHLKSLFLRPDSWSLSNTCKYIEDEDEAYIRWLCSFSKENIENWPYKTQALCQRNTEHASGKCSNGFGNISRLHHK